MHRLGLLTLGVVAFGSAACAMDNPAFDAVLDGDARTDGSEVADSTTEVGDGDPDPTKGDGDGDPTTGDGDGEPSETGTSDTGDGDGDGDPDPTTGDGDGDTTTTGDGDGEPDPMVVCMGFNPVEACQTCAADSCCMPGIGACYETTSCKCILECVLDLGKPLVDCANDCNADANVLDLAGSLSQCLSQFCNDVCP